ncbi:class I SAM-dependent methyltransferase [Seohaeicola zhoushanensis]|uniref:Methyltransferase n=1 Tax=Seohaeicola zhoushanensis TaxID=1569283 RepID=A0A8J3GX51_9RHOB|nr:methyltransferase domain-containing protein [Seohaeicola zhoushanensis]GHF45983.1 methyltransferase [Seohaeicola zhoushanensis]
MTGTNADQAEYWGHSPGGQKWITLQDQLDAALQPVLDLVLDRAALRPGQRVLDIGCGTGASVLAAAAAVGPTGHVLAADISELLLSRARERTAHLPNVELVPADAQVHRFGPDDRDAVISRFGVMFFEDTTAALANMARTLKPEGAMTFAAWGALDRNPWFTVPHIAAINRLGRPPRTDRNAPGPLAFHDTDRVLGMFRDAGLNAEAEVVELDLTLPGGPEGAADLVMQVGPAVRTMAHFNATPEDAAAIRAAVLEEFAARGSDDPFRLPAQINLFRATRPAG